MKEFIKTFARILGFFSATAIFLIIASMASFFFSDNKKLFNQINEYNKSNKEIAILNLNGPIISEPINFNGLNILNPIEAIYPSLVHSYLKELHTRDILYLIISINSPGGSVSASNKIYKLIQDFKSQKKIKIYFHSNEILASGGYWISLSGDKIFASYGTVIGSIGVKGPDWLYYNNPSSLSNGIFGNSIESQNGIKLFSNTAGVSKDIFNPFRPPTKNEKESLQKIVDGIYNDFVNLVSMNRKLEKKYIKEEIGAMIYSSKEASKNYLIDGEKSIQEVVEFVKKELKEKSINIISNKKDKSYNFFQTNLFSKLTKSNNSNYKKELIMNKFCNNIYNEFSTVVSNGYINKC